MAPNPPWKGINLHPDPHTNPPHPLPAQPQAWVRSCGAAAPQPHPPASILPARPASNHPLTCSASASLGAMLRASRASQSLGAKTRCQGARMAWAEPSEGCQAERAAANLWRMMGQSSSICCPRKGCRQGVEGHGGRVSALGVGVDFSAAGRPVALAPRLSSAGRPRQAGEWHCRPLCSPARGGPRGAGPPLACPAAGLAPGRRPHY